ncbi:MAG: hypothetical protein HQL29_00010 [Candidatus Omnitrophica bacterium]|nr:hypothetical protein [Candidatus Omnitrophota bacterium]
MSSAEIWKYEGVDVTGEGGKLVFVGETFELGCGACKKNEWFEFEADMMSILRSAGVDTAEKTTLLEGISLEGNTGITSVILSDNEFMENSVSMDLTNTGTNDWGGPAKVIKDFDALSVISNNRSLYYLEKDIDLSFSSGSYDYLAFDASSNSAFKVGLNFEGVTANGVNSGPFTLWITSDDAYLIDGGSIGVKEADGNKEVYYYLGNDQRSNIRGNNDYITGGKWITYTFDIKQILLAMMPRSTIDLSISSLAIDHFTVMAEDIQIANLRLAEDIIVELDEETGEDAPLLSALGQPVIDRSKGTILAISDDTTELMDISSWVYSKPENPYSISYAGINSKDDNINPNGGISFEKSLDITTLTTRTGMSYNGLDQVIKYNDVSTSTGSGKILTTRIMENTFYDNSGRMLGYEENVKQNPSINIDPAVIEMLNDLLFSNGVINSTDPGYEDIYDYNDDRKIDQDDLKHLLTTIGTMIDGSTREGIIVGKSDFLNSFDIYDDGLIDGKDLEYIQLYENFFSNTVPNSENFLSLTALIDLVGDWIEQNGSNVKFEWHAINPDESVFDSSVLFSEKENETNGLYTTDSENRRIYSSVLTDELDSWLESGDSSKLKGNLYIDDVLIETFNYAEVSVNDIRDIIEYVFDADADDYIDGYVELLSAESVETDTVQDKLPDTLYAYLFQNSRTGVFADFDSDPETLNMSSNTFTNNNDYQNGDMIIIKSQNYPTELEYGKTYYVINSTESTFQISTIKNGDDAVEFKNTGSLDVKIARLENWTGLAKLDENNDGLIEFVTYISTGGAQFAGLLSKFASSTEYSFNVNYAGSDAKEWIWSDFDSNSDGSIDSDELLKMINPRSVSSNYETNGEDYIDRLDVKKIRDKASELALAGADITVTDTLIKIADELSTALLSSQEQGIMFWQTDDYIDSSLIKADIDSNGVVNAADFAVNTSLVLATIIDGSLKRDDGVTSYLENILLPGDANWNYKYDINSDGIISFDDMKLLGLAKDEFVDYDPSDTNDVLELNNFISEINDPEGENNYLDAFRSLLVGLAFLEVDNPNADGSVDKKIVVSGTDVIDISGDGRISALDVDIYYLDSLVNTKRGEMQYDTTGRLLGYSDTVTTKASDVLVTTTDVTNIYYDRNGQMEGYDQRSGESTIFAIKTNEGENRGVKLVFNNYSDGNEENEEADYSDIQLDRGYLTFDHNSTTGFIFTVCVESDNKKVYQINIVVDGDVSDNMDTTAAINAIDVNTTTNLDTVDGTVNGIITYHIANEDLGNWQTTGINLYKLFDKLELSDGNMEDGDFGAFDHIRTFRFEGLDNGGSKKSCDLLLKNIAAGKDNVLTSVKNVELQQSILELYDTSSIIPIITDDQSVYVAPLKGSSIISVVGRRDFVYDSLQQNVSYRDVVWSSDDPDVTSERTVKGIVYNESSQIMSMNESAETYQNTLTVSSPGSTGYGIMSLTDYIPNKDANLYKSFMSFDMKGKYIRDLVDEEFSVEILDNGEDKPEKSGEDYIIYLRVKIINKGTDFLDKGEDAIIAIHTSMPTNPETAAVDGLTAVGGMQDPIGLNEAAGAEYQFNFYLLNHFEIYIDDKGVVQARKKANDPLADLFDIDDFGGEVTLKENYSYAYKDNSGNDQIISSDGTLTASRLAYAVMEGTLSIDQWLRLEDINVGQIVETMVDELGPKESNNWANAGFTNEKYRIPGRTLDHVKWFFMRGGTYTINNLRMAEDEYKTSTVKVPLSNQSWQVYDGYSLVENANSDNGYNFNIDKGQVLMIHNDSAGQAGLTYTKGQSINNAYNLMTFGFKYDTQNEKPYDYFVITVSVKDTFDKSYSLSYFLDQGTYSRVKYEKGGGYAHISLDGKENLASLMSDENKDQDGFITIARDIDRDLFDLFGVNRGKGGLSFSIGTRAGKYLIRDFRFSNINMKSGDPYIANYNNSVDMKKISETSRRETISMNKNNWKLGIGDVSIGSEKRIKSAQKWGMEYNDVNQLISFNEKSANSGQKTVYQISNSSDKTISGLFIPENVDHPEYITAGTSEFTLFVGKTHEDSQDNGQVSISVGNAGGASYGTSYNLIIRRDPDEENGWIWQLEKHYQGNKVIGESGTMILSKQVTEEEGFDALSTGDIFNFKVNTCSGYVSFVETYSNTVIEMKDPDMHWDAYSSYLKLDFRSTDAFLGNMSFTDWKNGNKYEYSMPPETAVGINSINTSSSISTTDAMSYNSDGKLTSQRMRGVGPASIYKFHYLESNKADFIEVTTFNSLEIKNGDGVTIYADTWGQDSSSGAPALKRDPGKDSVNLMRKINNWDSIDYSRGYNTVSYRRDEDNSVIGIDYIIDHKGFIYEFDEQVRPEFMYSNIVGAGDGDFDKYEKLAKITYNHEPDLVVRIYKTYGNDELKLKYTAYYDEQGTMIGLAGADASGEENEYFDYFADVVYDDITGEVITATVGEWGENADGNIKFTESTLAFYNGAMVYYTGETWTLGSSMSDTSTAASVDQLKNMFQSISRSIKDGTDDEVATTLQNYKNNTDTDIMLERNTGSFIIAGNMLLGSVTSNSTYQTNDSGVTSIRSSSSSIDTMSSNVSSSSRGDNNAKDERIGSAMRQTEDLSSIDAVQSIEKGHMGETFHISNSIKLSPGSQQDQGNENVSGERNVTIDYGTSTPTTENVDGGTRTTSYSGTMSYSLGADFAGNLSIKAVNGILTKSITENGQSSSASASDSSSAVGSNYALNSESTVVWSTTGDNISFTRLTSYNYDASNDGTSTVVRNNFVDSGSMIRSGDNIGTGISDNGRLSINEEVTTNNNGMLSVVTERQIENWNLNDLGQRDSNAFAVTESFIRSGNNEVGSGTSVNIQNGSVRNDSLRNYDINRPASSVVRVMERTIDNITNIVAKVAIVVLNTADVIKSAINNSSDAQHETMNNQDQSQDSDQSRERPGIDDITTNDLVNQESSVTANDLRDISSSISDFSSTTSDSVTNATFGESSLTPTVKPEAVLVNSMDSTSWRAADSLTEIATLAIDLVTMGMVLASTGNYDVFGTSDKNAILAALNNQNFSDMGDKIQAAGALNSLSNDQLGKLISAMAEQLGAGASIGDISLSMKNGSLIISVMVDAKSVTGSAKQLMSVYIVAMQDNNLKLEAAFNALTGETVFNVSMNGAQANALISALNAEGLISDEALSKINAGAGMFNVSGDKLDFNTVFLGNVAVSLNDKGQGTISGAAKFEALNDTAKTMAAAFGLIYSEGGQDLVNLIIDVGSGQAFLSLAGQSFGAGAFAAQLSKMQGVSVSAEFTNALGNVLGSGTVVGGVVGADQDGNFKGQVNVQINAGSAGAGGVVRIGGNDSTSFGALANIFGGNAAMTVMVADDGSMQLDTLSVSSSDLTGDDKDLFGVMDEEDMPDVMKRILKPVVAKLKALNDDLKENGLEPIDAKVDLKFGVDVKTGELVAQCTLDFGLIDKAQLDLISKTFYLTQEQTDVYAFLGNFKILTMDGEKFTVIPDRNYDDDPAVIIDTIKSFFINALISDGGQSYTNTDILGGVHPSYLSELWQNGFIERETDGKYRLNISLSDSEKLVSAIRSSQTGELLPDMVLVVSLAGNNYEITRIGNNVGIVNMQSNEKLTLTPESVKVYDIISYIANDVEGLQSFNVENNISYNICYAVTEQGELKLSDRSEIILANDGTIESMSTRDTIDPADKVALRGQTLMNASPNESEFKTDIAAMYLRGLIYEDQLPQIILQKNGETFDIKVLRFSVSKYVLAGLTLQDNNIEQKTSISKMLVPEKTLYTQTLIDDILSSNDTALIANAIKRLSIDEKKYLKTVVAERYEEPIKDMIAAGLGDVTLSKTAGEKQTLKKKDKMPLISEEKIKENIYEIESRISSMVDTSIGTPFRPLCSTVVPELQVLASYDNPARMLETTDILRKAYCTGAFLDMMKTGELAIPTGLIIFVSDSVIDKDPKGFQFFSNTFKAINDASTERGQKKQIMVCPVSRENLNEIESNINALASILEVSPKGIAKLGIISYDKQLSDKLISRTCGEESTNKFRDNFAENMIDIVYTIIKDDEIHVAAKNGPSFNKGLQLQQNMKNAFYGKSERTSMKDLGVEEFIEVTSQAFNRSKG